MDIVISLLTLAVLIPVLVALAMWIRLDSPGGAIFRQRRVGQGGKMFWMLKFRTMRTDVDPYGVSPHGPDDSRLTGVGRWLRERSLDELPQFWDVLCGSMSLVGPRPLYERQAETWTPHQRRRLEVRPGLTGLAQVSGRGEQTHEDKIELDVQYVERQSLSLDLKILVQTVRCVFGPSQNVIYEQRYSRDRTREFDSGPSGPSAEG